MQMTVKAIPQLTHMLERFPKVRVILDHLAKPSLSDGPPYDGAKDVFRLADYPNLYLKLTPRTVAEAQNGKASAETFFPLLISKFGASRIAWGSNYPASEGTLSELLKSSQAGLAVLSPDDRNWIFSKTALTLYPALAKS
jgi:predicted TIM-barrel fold metal-dependent hydrolase